MTADAAPEFVSFVVPMADDAPETVTSTVDSLLALDLPAYEVVVVDGGTRDEALWRPVEEFCRSHGVEFRHIPMAVPSREAAVKYAALLTHSRAAAVEVVEPGSRSTRSAAPIGLAAVAAAAPTGRRRGPVIAALALLALVAVGGAVIAGDLIPSSEPGTVSAVEDPSPSPTPSATGVPTRAPFGFPVRPSGSASPSGSPSVRPGSTAPAGTASPTAVAPRPVTSQQPAPARPPAQTAQPPPSRSPAQTAPPAPQPTSAQPQPTASSEPTPTRKPGKRPKPTPTG